MLGARTLVPVAAMIAALAGCPGSLKDPGRFSRSECPPDFDPVRAIFATSCGTSACHEGDSPAAELDLVSPGVAGRLVDVPSTDDCAGALRIDSADPTASLLLDKLTETPECGDPMPQVGPRVSGQDLACLREWVVATAAAGPAPQPMDAGAAPDAGGGTPDAGGSDGGS